MNPPKIDEIAPFAPDVRPLTAYAEVEDDYPDVTAAVMGLAEAVEEHLDANAAALWDESWGVGVNRAGGSLTVLSEALAAFREALAAAPSLAGV